MNRSPYSYKALAKGVKNLTSFMDSLREADVDKELWDWKEQLDKSEKNAAEIKQRYAKPSPFK
jgi:hypothetical protein